MDLVPSNFTSQPKRERERKGETEQLISLCQVNRSTLHLCSIESMNLDASIGHFGVSVLAAVLCRLRVEKVKLAVILMCLANNKDP